MKKWRADLGLTQEQAAERGGIPIKHYQSLEAGRRSYHDQSPANPTLDALRRLAKAYDTRSLT